MTRAEINRYLTVLLMALNELPGRTGPENMIYLAFINGSALFSAADLEVVLGVAVRGKVATRDLCARTITLTDEGARVAQLAEAHFAAAKSSPVSR